MAIAFTNLYSNEFFFFVRKIETNSLQQMTTPEDMRNQVVTAVAAVDSETIERSLQSLVTRFTQCIIVKEQYFEQYLLRQ